MAVTVRTGARSRARRGSTPVYTGRFGREQATRLLWRAGFGPAPGQAQTLARMGLRGAVDWLIDPPSRAPKGPKPRVENGPYAPRDVWGHDQLWWLDRMVRGQAPLIERMTLIWHDWFATSRSDVPTAQLMFDQHALLLRHALGRFSGLARDITKDPAMLLWLSGASNSAEAPNENYARELMELFTLGAEGGYTERDVREQARALTGWTSDWDDTGPSNFRFDPELHDRGTKVVFGRRGRFDWRDAVQLCVDHPAHATYVVRKLWSAFIPTAPSDATVRALARRYRDSGTQIAPIVRAILLHPALHAGPRMVKPPAVLVAGMLRATGRPVDTDAWGWAMGEAGQQLFHPPNVAGWDEDRWMDTATWRGRWTCANVVCEPFEIKDEKAYAERVGGRETPRQAVERALAFWDRPPLTPSTRRNLLAFAAASARAATADWERDTFRVLRQNALRQLIVTAPDYQTS